MTSARVAGDDALALFRLMLGIATPPHLGFTESPFRPAQNVGLYARVVHSEQRAKDSYKVFSAVINACYFLQIIVAAALTALGAANANNKAITAFGAINTIIAGFLTYLKGSGYPARLKYYASEWKKVREFIEHRERDFSLEGCTLDVYEVVNAVREMYDDTKREIEMNTPDNYNSKTSVRFDGVDTSKAEAIAGKLRGLLGTQASSVAAGVEAKADGVAGKLRGLDETVHKLKNHMGSVSQGVESKSVDVVTHLRNLEDTLEKVKSHVEKTARDGHDVAHRTVQDVAHTIQDEEKRALAEVRGLGKAVVREVEEHQPRPPGEVSITISHRDGNDHTGERR
jgi:archaellum component FlaC